MRRYAAVMLLMWAVVGAGAQDARHNGPASDALVGVEVVFTPSTGAARVVRRATGLLVRCDGFVLAPSALFAAPAEADANATMAVTVVAGPGTAQERRIRCRGPRVVARGVAYCAVKLPGVHMPAARVALSDAVRPGDELAAAWLPYDQAAGRFGPAERRTVRIAGGSAAPSADPPPPPPSQVIQDPPPVVPPRPPHRGQTLPPRRGASQAEAGTPSAEAPPALDLLVAEPVPGVPAGAVLLSPADAAIGMAPGNGPSVTLKGFASFWALPRVTNCITPLPGAAANIAPLQGDGMVDVPGGPVRMSALLLADQPDMEGQADACVAPFRADVREVTNREYLEFWSALPSERKAFLGFRSAHWPAGWSTQGAPFPDELAETPVIGVPLTGAAAYAHWRDKRLPTPYEWSLLALGPDAGKPPEWVGRYVEERNRVWDRVAALHQEYLALNPQLRQAGADVDPGAIPWLASAPVWRAAVEWSRRTVERALDPLWVSWVDPNLVVPGGTRAYDVSPWGVQDALLNAWELVAPYPGIPVRGAPRYVRIDWVQARYREPFREWTAAPVPDLLPDRVFGPQPLSRLYRRTVMSPPNDRLLALSSLIDVRGMLAPLRGWALRTDGATATTAAANPRPVGITAAPLGGGRLGIDAWAQEPPHFRREMGRPVPLESVERRVSTEPPLHYVLPVGFRCVR